VSTDAGNENEILDHAPVLTHTHVHLRQPAIRKKKRLHQRPNQCLEPITEYACARPCFETFLYGERVGVEMLFP
jgi:hypothetical protein